jgi:hypothetical protein
LKMMGRWPESLMIVGKVCASSFGIGISVGDPMV